MKYCLHYERRYFVVYNTRTEVKIYSHTEHLSKGGSISYLKLQWHAEI